jgi:sirohydrochlorin ferrochelatase
MNALLIVAHGSRRAHSNEALVELAAQVEALSGQPARCAFLQFGTPDLATALAELAQEAARITVVPLFLTAGKHLAEDIAPAVDRVRREHPGLAVTVSPHLGAWDGLPQAILALATQGEGM